MSSMMMHRLNLGSPNAMSGRGGSISHTMVYDWCKSNFGSSLLSYPLTALQARVICAQYLRSARRIHFSPNEPLPVILRAAAVPPQKWLLLRLVLSPFDLMVSQLRQIVQEESFFGLFKGYSMWMLYRVLKELTQETAVVFWLHPQNNRLWINLLRVQAAIQDMLYQSLAKLKSLLTSRASFMPASPLPGPLPTKPADQTPAVVNSELYRKDKRRRPNDSESLAGLELRDQFLIQTLCEVIYYPLLTVSTRLCLHEGPEKIGPAEMMQLTVTFDGISSLWSGLSMVLAGFGLDAMTAAMVESRCRLVTDSTQKLKLRLMGLACSSLLTGPLIQTAVVMRGRSAIPGLCSPSQGTGQIFLNMLRRSRVLFGVGVVGMLVIVGDSFLPRALFFTPTSSESSTTDTDEDFDERHEHAICSLSQESCCVIPTVGSAQACSVPTLS